MKTQGPIDAGRREQTFADGHTVIVPLLRFGTGRRSV